MKILNIFILMGCNCIRPQENNFLNLEVDKEKNKKNFLFETRNSTIKKNETILGTIQNEITVSKENESFESYMSINNKNDNNIEIFNCINKFRSDPYSLADLLIKESLNISKIFYNGKEIYVYKDIYYISGGKDLFVQVSNALKSLSFMNPLQFSEDLIFNIDNLNKIHAFTDEEKFGIEKNNELKINYFKEKLSNKYKNVEVLNHESNENIQDSIIMQIFYNFNSQNKKIHKRPFDIIFSNELKYIGICMLGGFNNLKGNLVFANQ